MGDTSFESNVADLKDLAKSTAYTIPKMREADFLKFLLPLIVNRDKVPNLDMTIWLSIAGNAHRVIDVVDGNNTVLFTVPPLLARVATAMPSLERDRQDISSLLHHYSAMRAVEHPATADAWFANAIEDTVIEIDSEDNILNLKRLVTIYTRYGISLESLLPGMETVEQQPTLGQDPEKADDTTGEFEDF